MNRKLIVKMTLLVALIVSGPTVHGQGQSLSTGAEQANKNWQEQNWTEAAKAYELLLKTEPGNGQAWFRLGSSLISLNKPSDAIGPLEKAAEIVKGPVVYYTLGSTYASLKNKEKALDNLMKAAGVGFANINRVKSDPNLAEIRDDARFKQVYERVEKNARPCKYSAEAKQLDFWVGEWEVMANGQVVGTNVIQQLEDGCLIMENWSGNGGASGKSMNFYNPVLKKWRQTYISNNHVIWEMSGEYKDGVMQLDGEMMPAANRPIMVRVRFYNQSPDKLRHTQDNSTDGGKTWTNVWDTIYIRKKATVSRN